MVAGLVAEKLLPQRVKMSYTEYLALADDTKLVEWVDGETIIYMPPLDRHQDLSLFLSQLIHAFVRFFNLGAVRYAPLEVKLWPDGPSREPDIFFVRSDHRHKLTNKRFEGGPDLVIEIVSPGSVTEDRVHKFTEYERAGVAEYWIVDPRLHQQQVDFYILSNKNRYQPAQVDNNGVYRSTVLSNFWINIDWLWQETLPDPQLALAEIMISLKDLPAETRDAYQKIYNLLAGR